VWFLLFSRGQGLCVLRGTDWNSVHNLDECQSSGQSPTCYRWGLDSIPGPSVWDLWCSNGHWDRFVSQYLCFPLKVIVPPVLHTRLHLLLLPEGQTDEVWKRSKKQCSFVNLGALARGSFFCNIHKVRRQYLYTSGGGKYASFCKRNRRKYNEWYRIRKKLCASGKGMHKWRKLKKDEYINVRMGDEYWFAKFVNSLVLWKACRSF